MNGTARLPTAGTAAPSRDAMNDAGEWPRRTFLEFAALPGAVPCARLHARQVMWEWGLGQLSEDTELVASELVTNGVRAAASLGLPGSLGSAAPVRMWLLGNAARVLVLVWDACPQPPIRLHAGHRAEGGRGLLLVEALSDQWDWYAVQQPEGGKIVWAAISSASSATPAREH
jgi:anti-sigma regulatory factor (Ser/Thr protein kinase)